ncbi:glutamic acid-rich protein-like [Pyrus ussuriensis x Pyrus communis]|uniref:Glutamic acid-rich protein-like n=1 Tax=Pyrus ussuriensis x Pyrus communis TaxID=2448454 RepID=A0A5N5HH83_9ROSA|nr:glutamic acid-rich protein-like [Pyrus ussuriensis x Pyrus communis]
MNTVPQKGSKKVSVTFVELERAFKECENEDNMWKIRLIFFADGVLIVVKSNVVVNLDYFDLIDDMDKFNNFHGVRYPLNNYRTTSRLLLLGEGKEKWMVMWKKMRSKRKKAREVRRGRDPERVAQVILDTFTSDINNVGELKVQIKELKVALTCFAHGKDFLEMKLLKKVEELNKEVNELRRKVKEKHVHEKNEEENDGKEEKDGKGIEEEKEEEMMDDEEGKEEEYSKEEEEGCESGGDVQRVIQQEEKEEGGQNKVDEDKGGKLRDKEGRSLSKVWTKKV